MTESNISNGDFLMQKLKQILFRGSHNILFQPGDDSLMTWNWQQKFLDATLNSNLIQRYPTSRQSMKLFLKKLIEYLEGSQQVHDDLYSHLCLAMKNSSTEDSFSYRHYLINNHKEIITIKETNKMVVNGTTGMRTWEAALMLADWTLSHTETFENKTILELGSGIGFTGITIGKLCQPKCMFLSDCHPEVMKTICDNIRINFPQSEVTESNDATLFKIRGKTIGAIPLDWNSLEDLPNDVVPDIVIGADIVYDPSILQPLCEVLSTFFNRNNQLDVFIASVVRNKETFNSFLNHLGKMNFIIEKLFTNKSTYIEWDHTIEHCLLKINCSNSLGNN